MNPCREIAINEAKRLLVAQHRRHRLSVAPITNFMDIIVLGNHQQNIGKVAEVFKIWFYRTGA